MSDPSKANDFQSRLERDNRRRYINQSGGDEAILNNGNYSINQYSFPENVGTNDAPHYVSFFINVRGKSKYNTENRFTNVAITRDNDAHLTPEQINTSLAAVTTLGAAAALGTAAAKKVAASKKGSSNSAVKTGQKAAVGVVGAAVGGAAGLGAYKAITSSDTFKPDQSYRIKDVITLAAQEPPQVSYSASYTQTNLGAIFGMLSKGIDAVANQGMSAFLSPTAGEAAAVAGAALGGAAIGGLLGGGKIASFGGAIGGAVGSNLVTGSAMQSMAKVKTNPFREMLFEMVEFRKFKFQYKFLPKSRAEVDAIKNIIDLFKFHMHPELSAGNLFFIYPAEFQIIYYFKNKENAFFQKIAPSALTDLSVVYGGAGGMSTFHDGAPTEINMSLEFTELEVLTKEKIELGY